MDADFICCRMTLEHIHNVLEFVSMVRAAIGDRTDVVVAFQVPDTRRILGEAAFWDIYYEHCSYFTPRSLEALFRRAGFEPLDIYTQYDDQYLHIEAVPGQRSVPVDPAHEALRGCAQDENRQFRQRLAAVVRTWEQQLAGFTAAGRRVVPWGSGSKAVTFLNSLNVGEEMPCVVDINPHKHGKFLAGTGHQIIGPLDLREQRPDVVLAMNPIYQQEIQEDLHRLSVAAELFAL